MLVNKVKDFKNSKRGKLISSYDFYLLIVPRKSILLKDRNLLFNSKKINLIKEGKVWIFRCNKCRRGLAQEWLRTQILVRFIKIV